MECYQATRLLHRMQDEQIEQQCQKQLQQHLDECIHCRETEASLKQTVALLRTVSLVQAPTGFTEQVLQRLPAPDRRRQTGRLLAVAAAVLLLLASPIYFSDTLNNPQLICQDRQAVIIQEGGSFIVPADAVVRGDITVYRSDLLVRGQVLGDVQVVDGEFTLLDAGTVSGNVMEHKSSGALRLKLALAELWEDIGRWLLFR
ncbi:MAG: hypothetical protein ACOX2K_09790 [Bacillota bacterium]|jgi:anti-sigma factor RsiW